MGETLGRRRFSTLVLLIMASMVAEAFVQPFGIHRIDSGAAVFRQMDFNPVDKSVCSRHISFFSQTTLHAKRKAAMSSDDEDEDEKDDDWEPTEEDLINDLEDLSLDVENLDDVLIDDDGLAPVVSEEDEDEDVTITAVDDDDDDDDEDEDDLDIWEEDDEEDEEEYAEEWEEVDEDQPTAYLGAEQDYEDEDWDEDEGNSNVPLMDDPDDPDYMAQKKLVEETIARRDQVKADKEFDEVEYVLNGIPPELAKLMENTDFMKESRQLEDKIMLLEEEDLKDINLEEQMAKTSDLMIDDPYESDGNDDLVDIGMTENEMQHIDETYKRMQKVLNEEPRNKVDYKVEITDLESLDNETLSEMSTCLSEIEGSSYNVTRWLLYDLDFNVSNLILAAVKHNREAPVIFQHWFPQLTTYSRYKHAQDREFDFNWDDVNGADVSELERYYQGFGYNQIPTKAPAETGIIGFEDLDEEELKMAAFENWMIEVYNPEWDKKDFDDDTFQDEDNVFSDFYEAPQHPDLPAYDDVQEEVQNWREDMEEEGEDNQEYLDFMAKESNYEFIQDDEFKNEFRGHLIVACTPNDEDIEVAEKITARMNTEFGKKIYVETRVMAHAREEDNAFEVWLESYEIDLLHSKKRASSNSESWDGPIECDDDQIEYLVERVRFLTSEEARYSYRFELDENMVV